MDMEKVIKGLAYCQYSSKSHCYECPYVYEGLCSTNYCTADLASDVFSLLKEQEPMKHGRWKREFWFITCSVCDYCSADTDDEGDEIATNYCPNCGAKMDLQEEHDAKTNL